MGRLNYKVAVITGAASGIGKAAARLFAAEGAKVVVADVDAANGEAVAAAIRAGGGDAMFVEADVSQTASVQAMVARTIETYGAIHILYNNAAATSLCNHEDRRVTELPEWVWDRMIAVTLKGVYLCCKYVIPAIIRAGGGSVINTASVDALVGQGGYDAYTAAKGGVVALTRSLAVGFADDGIRVNCICPGFVATEVQAEWLAAPTSRQAIAALHLTRIGQPQDVARFALFLASDDAAYVTGGIFLIDGGFTAFKTRVLSYDALAHE